jgi:hypothetical protein
VVENLSWKKWNSRSERSLLCKPCVMPSKSRQKHLKCHISEPLRAHLSSSPPEKGACQMASLFCMSRRGRITHFWSLLLLVRLYLKCPLTSTLTSSVWIVMKALSQESRCLYSHPHPLDHKNEIWSQPTEAEGCQDPCLGPTKSPPSWRTRENPSVLSPQSRSPVLP